MSSKICKAIGYGMTSADFEAACLLPPNEDGACAASRTSEMLSDIKELVVPAEFRKKTWHTPGMSSIVHTDLLRSMNAPRDRAHDAGVLMQTVCIERPSHVIFFPGYTYAKLWYRSDDDIDYAFERWAEGSHPQARTNVAHEARFVAYGPHPFDELVMQPDGTPAPWEATYHLIPNPELVAGVPSEIRWFLTHLGILDDRGVNRLRPLIARWWD